MCDPVSIGLAIVTTAVSVIGQSQAAKAQAKAINNANQVRQNEIDKASTAEINTRLRQARRERGNILVAAGEAGLSLDSGNVETMLLDTYQQTELSNDNSLANRESRRASTQADAESAMSKVSSPTLLGAGLQIGLAGANAGVKAQNAKAKAGG